MRLALVFVIVIHGLIHLLGFAKAFNLFPVAELTQPISRSAGVFWFQTALLFLFVAIGILMKKDWWWMLAIIAVLLSQFLIIGQWQDAKFGTFLNVIILTSAVFAFTGWNFHRRYQTDVRSALNQSASPSSDLISEADILNLPVPVQRYLRYVGVVNTPRLRNVKIVFDGEMRGKEQDWFPFHSEQYNTFASPHRLFFMRGKMKGLNVPGYHAYKDGTATMQIKLFGLIPVVNMKGKEMNISETVTVFNDMCIMAPASLLDPRIQWEDIDSLSVKATFTLKGISVSAQLLFNPAGQLINFISDDRYALTGKTTRRLRFSTPMSDYKSINGFNVPSYGEAIWHYPEGDFVYGKFYLKGIFYNVE